MLRVLFLVIFIIYNISEARIVTLQEIHQMPRSIEKDYYIWRFLRYKATTPAEAKIAIKEISHINKKLQKAYQKKTGLRVHKTAPKKKTPKKLKNKEYSFSNSRRLFFKGSIFGISKKIL